MAEVNPGGSPTIMLDGHIDEIGVIVQYIDDDGFVYISPIGGWDPQVLVGQRIRFLGRGGDVLGVVGKKPIHLMKADDREQASKITDLWVDIGASNRAEAEGRLSVGDPGRDRLASTIDFPNNRIVSRSIDDRIGAFVVLEALRRYAQNPGPARVVAAATTQEEIAWHGGGALVCTQLHQPADGDRRRRHLRDRSSEHREEGDRRSPDRRRSGAQPRRDHLAGRVRAAARRPPKRHENHVLGARGGPRHVAPTPTRFTSRARASRRRSSRSRTATCTRRTSW